MKQRTLYFLLILFSLSMVLLSCDKRTTEPKEQCAAPTFSPVEGNYSTVQHISLACSTPDATIRYTTDGTVPTTASAVYSSPISVAVATTIKAVAILEGWTDSQVASASYNIQYNFVSSPSFDPPGGTYAGPQIVSISCDTPGATIRFTTDGSDPDSSSAIYTALIVVASTATVKARASKADWIDSPVVTGAYTIQTVASPVFTPTGGTYEAAQLVSILCETSGATIRYTTNGSNPTSSSPIYTAPIAVGSTTTIKAQAFKAGWGDSPVVTGTYTIQTVAAPVFTPTGGTYEAAQLVSILCETSGATIRYTTNGSNPTSSSTLYTAPIAVGSTTTIKAQAFKAGWGDSQIVSATYNIPIQTVASPTFNPPAGTYSSFQSVTISCSTTGATIRYTIDGSEPINSSIPYTAPLNVTSIVTIKAKAFRIGMNESQTAQAHYNINIPIPANFVLVHGGTFNNGTANVTISAFYIDKYETRQSEYISVMESNPSTGAGEGDYYPAYNTNWFNAIEYCNRRSIREYLTPCYTYGTYGMNTDYWPVGWDTDPGNHTNVSCNWEANGYRLTTEMEWMYAAQGGTATSTYTYSGSNYIDDVAWYIGNSGNSNHSAGTRGPNMLGLYDMSGSVWEWNWDIQAAYPAEAQENPHGAESGIYRMCRGGAWQANPNQCAIAYRSYGYADRVATFVGFRVCRNLP